MEHQPHGGEKRVRSHYLVRQRYARSRKLANWAGLSVLAFAAGAVLAGGQARPWILAAVLLAAVLPRLLVEVAWRWIRRRHFWDWQ
jgi:Flp pilus assembly protein TadB